MQLSESMKIREDLTMEEFRQKRNDVLAQAVIKGLSSRNMTGYDSGEE